MREQTKGILKITEGWAKRVIGLVPFVLFVASAGVGIGCGFASIIQHGNIVGQYQQNQSYIDHIKEEKNKLREELSAGMTLEEFSEKNKELDSEKYAIEFLKTIDEKFAKDYKLFSNTAATMFAGLGMFTLASIAFFTQQCTSDNHDSFLIESSEKDINEGELLLGKAKFVNPPLPPDEHAYASVEDEYK